MEIRDKDMMKWVKGLLLQGAGSCPDEEELASFIEDKLKGSKQEEMVRHILSCERCQDAVAAAIGPAPDKGVRVPARAMKEAVNLAPAREGLWEIAVNFVADAVEVIKNSGDRTQYFTPAYATMRGPGVAPGSLVAFSRRFAGIDVEVEVERVAPHTSDIKITARNVEGGNHPKGLRANLYRKDKELMSYMLQGGSAAFEKVKFGNYKIDFTRRGAKVGEIALGIKGE